MTFEIRDEQGNLVLNNGNAIYSHFDIVYFCRKFDGYSDSTEYLRTDHFWVAVFRLQTLGYTVRLIKERK